LLKITSTDTSIGCNRAGACSGSASATLNWFG
jgi:hypothetical protein